MRLNFNLKVMGLIVSSTLLASCSNFHPSRTPQSLDKTPDFLVEGGNEVILDNCGGKNGTAKLERKSGTLYLVINGVNRNYCSRWVSSRDNYRDINIFKDNGNEVNIDIPINEENPGERTILIASQGFIDGFKSGHSYTALVNDNKKGDMLKFVIKAPAKDTTPDYITEGGKPAVLENCGGKDGRAYLRREAGNLYLYISGVECAYWATSRNNYAQSNHIEDYNGDHSREKRILIDESEPGYRTIIIGSKKYLEKLRGHESLLGSSGDVIKFYVKPQVININMAGGASSATAQLLHCGGTVESKINNGRLSLIFRGLNDCDKYRFITANGDKISDDMSLQKQGRSFGGSFTISKKYIQHGLNNFTVSVYQKDGTEDIIKLQAVGFNWLDALIDMLD